MKNTGLLHARTAAGLAGAGLIAALLWSCSSQVSTASPTAPGASPASLSSILEATGTPTPALSPSPSMAAPSPTATRHGGSAGQGGGGAGGGPTGVTAPIPTPRPGVNVTIVAAGDIACDPAQNKGTPQDCDQAATADLIGQIGPTAVLTLGDNQYESGTAAAYKAVFAPTWGKYKSIMYPAIGNHEYLTNGAAGYFGYFNVPAYYSFNLGDWHMISLDSECSYVGGCQAGSKQEQWLLADLAAHPSVCTLVYWHEPRWSSGEHQDATQMSTIWADLAAAHVSVVLSGHNHDYERFSPLNANGQVDPAGPTEFVVGTGGKNHYGFTVAPLNGELVRNDQSFGVIKMTLGPTSYSWSFVPAPGYTFHDSGSANCVG
jgi:hypothetical protein